MVVDRDLVMVKGPSVTSLNSRTFLIISSGVSLMFMGLFKTVGKLNSSMN